MLGLRAVQQRKRRKRIRRLVYIGADAFDERSHQNADVCYYFAYLYISMSVHSALRLLCFDFSFPLFLYLFHAIYFIDLFHS